MAVIKVFVVDDSYTFRTLLKKQLHTQNYKIVAEAQNGKEALAMYKDIEADVVIVDLKMPVMDGIELIPKLMAINPSQRILAVTTGNNRDELEEVKSLGALDALRKPFQPGFLFSRLEKVLETPMPGSSSVAQAECIEEEAVLPTIEPAPNENIPIINIEKSQGQASIDTTDKTTEALSTVNIQKITKEEPPVINITKKVEAKQPQLIKKVEIPTNGTDWEEEVSDFIIEIPSSNSENKDIITVKNEDDTIVFDPEFEQEIEEKSNQKLAELLKDEAVVREPDEIDIGKPSEASTDDVEIDTDSREGSKRIEISQPSMRLSFADRHNLSVDDDDDDEIPDLSIFLNDKQPTYESTKKVGKKSVLGKLKNIFKQ